MSIEMLTYGALGARLDISAEAARAVARRLRLPRSRSTDGKLVVAVDLEGIRHRRRARVERAAAIEVLQAQIVRLAATAESHQADFERERERADRLAGELAELTAEVNCVKEATKALEGAVAGLRIVIEKQPPSRLARLTASVVEADRRACR